MIAIRTARKVKVLAVLFAAYLGMVAIAAGIFMGDRTYWASFKLWLWGLPLVLLAWIALEAGGTWFFERPALRKMSSPARIAVGVVVLITVVGLASAIQWLITRHAL